MPVQTGNILFERWLFIVRFFVHWIYARGRQTGYQPRSQDWRVGLDSYTAAEGGLVDDHVPWSRETSRPDSFNSLTVKL